MLAPHQFLHALPPVAEPIRKPVSVSTAIGAALADVAFEVPCDRFV